MNEPKTRSALSAAPAWLVHALTASGAVLAFLALAAISESNWRGALLWLGAAMAIDGVDGFLARRLHVRTRLPRVDGAILDFVVDYLTYVFVPAIFIAKARLIPSEWAPALVGLILLSSLYCFARSDMKTDDNYFRGFPALWNVIAFYLFVAQFGAAVGALIVLILAILTFAPIHVVHPFRVRDYGIWLPLLALGWAVSAAALTWPGWSEDVRAAWLGVSIGTAVILLMLGLWRSFRGPLPGGA